MRATAVSAQPYTPTHDTLPSRANNADFVRFAAASGVVLSHSYAMAGHFDREPIVRLSGGLSNIGQLMVGAFFILSGYLITQSYQRRQNPVSFTLARIRRLWPALTVVVLLTVFVYGPLMTTLPVRDYFASDLTWRYFRAFILNRMPQTLPGVLEGGVLSRNVNGSLWTLEFEAGCYLAVLVLGMVGLLRRPVAALLIVPLIVLCAAGPRPNGWLTLPLAFACGGFWALGDDKPRLTLPGVVIAASAILAALVAQRGIAIAIALAGSYLVLGFVFHPIPQLARWAEYVGGDLSYGVYIYAWPIQQAVWYFAPGPTMPTWLNFVIAYPLILICAKASWQWVERPWLQR